MTHDNPPSIKTSDITVSDIAINNHPQFMGHENVFKIQSPQHGFTAFIGVHSTALGPGLGGTRYKEYATEDEALSDVLRLSEAMTWKNSAGEINHGGGKTVVMAIEGQRLPSDTTLQILAQGLNIINQNSATYFGAADMNVGESCLNYMQTFTKWIKGTSSTDPKIVGGDPSPLTALGVYECMKVAAKHKLNKNSLSGVRVSMQGLGAVGRTLAKYVYDDGGIITGCDTNPEAFTLLNSMGVEITQVGLDEIYDAPADIFAPNAIGGTLTAETIDRIKTAGVKIICGAANNQQQDQIGGTQSRILRDNGILYCPDYIVNAGGVIWVAHVGDNTTKTTEIIRSGVPRRFESLLEKHEADPTSDMASLAAQYSRRRVQNAKEESSHDEDQTRKAC